MTPPAEPLCAIIALGVPASASATVVMPSARSWAPVIRVTAAGTSCSEMGIRVAVVTTGATRAVSCACAESDTGVANATTSGTSVQVVRVMTSVVEGWRMEPRVYVRAAARVPVPPRRDRA